MNTKLEDEVRDLALHGLDMGCPVRLMDPGSSRTQAYVTVSLDSLRRVSRNGDAVVEITSADGSKRRFVLDVAHVEASSGPFESAVFGNGEETEGDAAEDLEYDEAASEIDGMLSNVEDWSPTGLTVRMVGWQSGQLHLAVNQAVRLRGFESLAHHSPLARQSLHGPRDHTPRATVYGCTVDWQLQRASNTRGPKGPGGSTPQPASASRLQSVY